MKGKNESSRLEFSVVSGYCLFPGSIFFLSWNSEHLDLSLSTISEFHGVVLFNVFIFLLKSSQPWGILFMSHSYSKRRQIVLLHPIEISDT